MNAVMKALSPLPMEAAALLPHTGRMLCVDRLLSRSGGSGVAEAVLVPGHILLAGNALDPAGYVELAAQAAGLVQGHARRTEGREPGMGYLAGVQDFRIVAEARVGDVLRLEITAVAELGNVSVVSAVIFRDGETLAEGTLKVYSAA